MLCGYAWRWGESTLEHIAAEQSFVLPLRNPQTGKSSTVFQLAGKIDGIVRLKDGRLAVKESKLFGDDISLDSSLWRRLRIDHQISLYVLAGRQLGYDVSCVLYDVTRKPTIRPKLVKGAEQKAFASLGEYCGERFEPAIVDHESPRMFGARLNNDISERPDFYFQRHEIARLDGDLAEFESEVWDIQQTIRTAQREGKWYRTVNRNTCEFCSFFGPCTSGVNVETETPEGFQRVENVHPELGATL
jgi:hypothetical protein